MRENVVETAVEICLDGQDFILRYRALAFIEYAKLGADLLNDVRTLGTQLTEIGELARAGEVAQIAPFFEKLRDILWAGLIDAQPSIGREEVARLFSLRDLQPLAVQIGKAITAGLPEVKSDRPIKPARKIPGRSSHLPNGADSGASLETQAASDIPSSAG